MTQLHEAALYYITLGWKIFPLAPGQKTPLTSHGCKDATGDQNQINEWWKRWPNANIGLLCGSQSGIFVVDIDIREKAGIDGFISLREFPSLPETVRQDTPSGGSHFLYSTNVAPRNKNDFRRGIDIRSDGYYIVLSPSAHPGGGVYNWSISHAPWDRSPAEFPDFMRPGQVTHAKPITVSIPIPATQRQQVTDRARLYLAQCDPAIQGQGGHDKLLWASVALVHGFLLSDSQTFDLLASEYNAGCLPPWDLSNEKDHRDFCRKISEARKLKPQRASGWLLDDPAYAPPTTVVDLQSILGQRAKPVVEISNGDTMLSSAATLTSEQEYQYLIRPTGLLGEICSWINSTAIKEQPFLSLACALAFLGALFGRKVKDSLGSRTNLYCMGVAPSSAGKAHAMNQIRRLASQSNCTSILGGDDIASDSAIEDRVFREPATLFMWDEIGHLLSHIKSGVSAHHAQVVSLLMKLYSSSGNVYLGKEYANQASQRVITQPCCCIYGTSTPERFTGGLSPSELQDGWLSRCLVFCSMGEVQKQRGRSEQAIPQSIVDQVTAWSARVVMPIETPTLASYVQTQGHPAPEQIVVPTQAEAEAIFQNFDTDAVFVGKTLPGLSCLWAKGEENARRIALIIAASESFDSPSISPSIASYACRLMKYILMDFCAIIAPEITSGVIEASKRKLFKAIESFGPDGAEKCDVTRRTPGLKKKDRDELLADLIESGTVAFQPFKNGKSNTYRYWTAENYARSLSDS